MCEPSYFMSVFAGIGIIAVVLFIGVMFLAAGNVDIGMQDDDERGRS